MPSPFEQWLKTQGVAPPVQDEEARNIKLRQEFERRGLPARTSLPVGADIKSINDELERTLLARGPEEMIQARQAQARQNVRTAVTRPLVTPEMVQKLPGPLQSIGSAARELTSPVQIAGLLATAGLGPAIAPAIRGGTGIVGAARGLAAGALEPAVGGGFGARLGAEAAIGTGATLAGAETAKRVQNAPAPVRVAAPIAAGLAGGVGTLGAIRAAGKAAPGVRAGLKAAVALPVTGTINLPGGKSIAGMYTIKEVDTAKVAWTKALRSAKKPETIAALKNELDGIDTYRDALAKTALSDEDYAAYQAAREQLYQWQEQLAGAQEMQGAKAPAFGSMARSDYEDARRGLHIHNKADRIAAAQPEVARAERLVQSWEEKIDAALSAPEVVAPTQAGGVGQVGMGIGEKPAQGALLENFAGQGQKQGLVNAEDLAAQQARKAQIAAGQTEMATEFVGVADNVLLSRRERLLRTILRERGISASGDLLPQLRAMETELDRRGASYAMSQYPEHMATQLTPTPVASAAKPIVSPSAPVGAARPVELHPTGQPPTAVTPSAVPAVRPPQASGLASQAQPPQGVSMPTVAQVATPPSGVVPPVGVTPPTSGVPTPTGPTPGAGITRVIDQASAIVRRDQQATMGRVMSRVPGVKQVKSYLLPSQEMPTKLRVAWVGQGAAKATVSNELASKLPTAIQELETTFGKGSATTRDFQTGVRFIGPTDQQVPFSGTLKDIAERPQLYDLTTEQKTALTHVQEARSADFNAMRDAYNLDISEFPVPEGGMHLATTGVDEMSVKMAGSERGALMRGRAKERVYSTGAERWMEDNTFTPNTNVAELLHADNETLASMAGQNVLDTAAGGKTRLEVMKAVKPALYTKMMGLRKRVGNLRSMLSDLNQETSTAIDDFLASPGEDVDLTALQAALDPSVVPGRYVAKSSPYVGMNVEALQAEIAATKAEIKALQPAWKSANLKPYTFVGDALSLYKYFPIEEAEQIRRLAKTSDSATLRFIDNLRATAFGGDLSPMTIQGATAWLADPTGVSKVVAGGIARSAKEGKPLRAFSMDALAADMRANPERWNRWSLATGIAPLQGPGQEFSVGFMGKLPKVGKAWVAANEGLYTPLMRLSEQNFNSIYEAGLKQGLTKDMAAAVAADDVTKLIPQYSWRRWGLSQQESARRRAWLTSVSFLTQPTAMVADASKGLVKLGLKQTITPTERFAVQRVVTLTATASALSAVTAAAYAARQGQDVEKATRDALNPSSGKFMALTLPNGARIGLGGPYRSIIRAVTPREVKGVPVPMPLGGLFPFVQNKLGPALRIAYDEIRNKDYYGKAIRTGDFPINILQGLEYAGEGSIPLAAGSSVEQLRKGATGGVVAQEASSQFLGTNLVARDAVYEMKQAWKKDLAAYNAIPTNDQERQAKYKSATTKAERDKYVYSRDKYRTNHPDVDAKLFVAGAVSSLQTAQAGTQARNLMLQNSIKPEDVDGIKSRLETVRKAKAAGIKPPVSVTVDKLIRDLAVAQPTQGKAKPNAQVQIQPQAPAPTQSAFDKWYQSVAGAR